MCRSSNSSTLSREIFDSKLELLLEFPLFFLIFFDGKCGFAHRGCNGGNGMIWNNCCGVVVHPIEGVHMKHLHPMMFFEIILHPCADNCPVLYFKSSFTRVTSFIHWM